MDDKEKLFSFDLTYLFHSGFTIETDECILIFDYWQDPSDIVKRTTWEKHVYCFSSHFHEDHFTRKIFDWKAPNITYILSKDILKHRRASKEDADIWMSKGMKWGDGMISVWATGSNDSGVSWIVEIKNKRIFHAGDLCNWNLSEEKRYLGELKDIRKIADSFDIVMFPVDSRIGIDYSLGARQFAERFKVGMFIPMHFSTNGFDSIWRTSTYFCKNGIPYWKIRHDGDHITIFDNIYIRKTESKDIPRLLEIFSIARKFMADTGNPNQWTDNYPGEQILSKDIASGNSYVCVYQNSIIATFLLSGGEDPTYRIIHNGAWLNDYPYATIHRIASDGKVKGIFRYVMKFALQYYNSIRIDTHSDNKIMQKAIRNVGMEYCGIINCWNGSERLAFQYYEPNKLADIPLLSNFAPEN